MSIEHPDYWLAYLSAATGVESEITATAPPSLDRSRFGRDARVVLAGADAYQSTRPWQRVVFAAEVTRWLAGEKGVGWEELDVDFDEALADIDRAPSLLIEASPIALAVVANTADHRTIFVTRDEIDDVAAHTEGCRRAILETLERDWPSYARGVGRRP